MGRVTRPTASRPEEVTRAPAGSERSGRGRGIPDRSEANRGGVATTADPRHDRTVVLVALVVMAVTTALAVIANALTRPVNADDLAWQRLLDIWGGQGHASAWISEDLFPTRYPLYLVLDALGIHGRRGVNVAAVVLDVAAGAAFLGGLVLSRELARPLRWRIVPALAVVSVWATVTWDQVFFSPNTRHARVRTDRPPAGAARWDRGPIGALTQRARGDHRARDRNLVVGSLRPLLHRCSGRARRGDRLARAGTPPAWDGRARRAGRLGNRVLDPALRAQAVRRHLASGRRQRAPHHGLG